LINLGASTGGLSSDALIVKADGGGIYQIIVTSTIEAVSSGIELVGALFINDEIVQKVNYRFNFQTSNDVASLAASGLIVLEDLDEIDFRFKSVSASETVGIINFNITFARLGD